jgi:hypothetical protein
MDLNNIILRNSPASLSLQKLVIKNNTTTLAGFHHSDLNPNFVTGFSDAESSFRLNIYKSKNVKIG